MKLTQRLGLFATLFLSSAGCLLAQTSDMPENAKSGGLLGGLIGLLFAALMIASMWKIFVKAGVEGWKCLIPFYNLYMICKIAGKPGWWLALFLVPFVNFIVILLLTIALAKSFGKGVGFGIGMIFLGFIFYPILAFGDATYIGNSNQ